MALALAAEPAVLCLQLLCSLESLHNFQLGPGTYLRDGFFPFPEILSVDTPEMLIELSTQTTFLAWKYSSQGFG